MFSSDAISRDFHHSNPSHAANFKHDADFSKSRDFVPSDFFTNHDQHQHQQSSGLARYRSAPSSFLAALLDSNTDNNSSSGDESDAFFSALMERDLNPNPNPKSSDHQISSGGMKREDEADPEPRSAQNGYPAGYDGSNYSVGMEHHRLRDQNGNRSNLLRQSSSPAGFFNGKLLNFFILFLI